MHASGRDVIFRLREIFAKCPAEFEEYRKCMDKSQMKYGKCRSQEKSLMEAWGAKS